MTYELWDTDSANVLGDFGSEREALGVVLDLVGVGNPAGPLVLVAIDQNNEAVGSIAGYALLDHAYEVLPRATTA